MNYLMRSYSALKIHKLIFHAAALFILIIPAVIYAQTFPPKPSPARLVNDYTTNTLSPEENEALERKLVAFDRSTSTQIVVVIMETLDGYPIDDYTIRLGEAWGVGQKDKDNGAVLLAAMKDRQVFIATGYGLEGVIPDALAKRIIEYDIKPYFKQGRYYEGLNRATDSMIALSKGEYKADRFPEQGTPANFYFIFFIVIFLVFLLFILTIARRARTITANNDIPFWLALILANMGSRRQHGKWDDFSSGGGSFGGGGGGDFGGFGGGSFGGGGAGGSW